MGVQTKQLRKMSRRMPQDELPGWELQLERGERGKGRVQTLELRFFFWARRSFAIVS